MAHGGPKGGLHGLACWVTFIKGNCSDIKSSNSGMLRHDPYQIRRIPVSRGWVIIGNVFHMMFLWCKCSSSLMNQTQFLCPLNHLFLKRPMNFPSVPQRTTWEFFLLFSLSLISYHFIIIIILCHHYHNHHSQLASQLLHGMINHLLGRLLELFSPNPRTERKQSGPGDLQSLGTQLFSLFPCLHLPTYLDYPIFFVFLTVLTLLTKPYTPLHIQYCFYRHKQIKHQALSMKYTADMQKKKKTTTCSHQ